MAVTATANLATRTLVVESLDMQGCHLICKIPNKPNIYYSVIEKPGSYLDILQSIIDDLCTHGEKCDRHIVFCRTYDDAMNMFQSTVLALDKQGCLYAINKEGKRSLMCDKFDACTAESTKAHIIEDFTDPEGIIRVVFATVAFAMGLDSPNIRHIIHWGPPTDAEMYVQETGRAGRDGKFSKATLYFNHRDISVSSHIESSMRAYCENSSLCRRYLLMSQFEQSPHLEHPKFLHMCCDVCMRLCKCSECEKVHNEMDGIEEVHSPLPVTPTQISPEKKKEVIHALIDIRRIWCRNSVSPTAYLLVGDEVCTGLTNNAIDYIVENFDNITTEEQLLNLGVASRAYCQQLLLLICKLKK